jgi:hypothetical protein
MNSSRTEPTTRGGTDSPSSPIAASALSRRAFAGGVAAVAGMSLLGSSTTAAGAGRAGTSIARRGPDGFGSVATAPQLPRTFARTFESSFIRANGIRQHVVVGGDGPRLLLVHGWPENWYAGRFLMPARPGTTR